MSVASRTKELRDSLGLTQQKFADRLGITRGAVANWDLDLSDPSDAVISLICREFNVREAWLRDGEGDMLEQRTRREDIALYLGKGSSGKASELSELTSALSKSRDLRKKLGLALGSLESKG